MLLELPFKFMCRFRRAKKVLVFCAIVLPLFSSSWSKVLVGKRIVEIHKKVMTTTLMVETKSQYQSQKFFRKCLK